MKTVGEKAGGRRRNVLPLLENKLWGNCLELTMKT